MSLRENVGRLFLDHGEAVRALLTECSVQANSIQASTANAVEETQVRGVDAWSSALHGVNSTSNGDASNGNSNGNCNGNISSNPDGSSNLNNANGSGSGTNGNSANGGGDALPKKSEDDLLDDRILVLSRTCIGTHHRLQKAVKQLEKHQAFHKRLVVVREKLSRRDERICELAAKLWNADQMLEAVIDKAQTKLRTMEMAKKNRLDPSEIITYSHKISYTTSAPPGWAPGESLMQFRPPHPQEGQMRAGVLYTQIPELERLVQETKRAEATALLQRKDAKLASNDDVGGGRSGDVGSDIEDDDDDDDDEDDDDMAVDAMDGNLETRRNSAKRFAPDTMSDDGSEEDVSDDDDDEDDDDEDGFGGAIELDLNPNISDDDEDGSDDASDDEDDEDDEDLWE
eukprot:TRINITY_DN232_c0_g1_i2.p1 TRINITY_DN232_c0_g1~~TRINITY_DN232_c0_g1_i2.p1  ORF type:complete len:400 (+),score=117.17 TRINITY_DN232_c0_g1_i2:225-1424(+)